jgi:ketosteroid isomerase-like protein
MPRARPSAATLGGSSDDIEAAFYDALQRGDIDLLMQCWADEEDVVCIHPGGPRQLGVAAIRAAFESMFSQGSVRARLTQVHRVQTMSSAVHSVTEQIEILLPDGVHHVVIFATNVYLKTPEGWRMVAHHASHGDGASETADPGDPLHPSASPPRSLLH